MVGGSGGAWIVLGALRHLMKEGEVDLVGLMVLACPDVSMRLGAKQLNDQIDLSSANVEQGILLDWAFYNIKKYQKLNNPFT